MKSKKPIRPWSRQCYASLSTFRISSGLLTLACTRLLPSIRFSLALVQDFEGGMRRSSRKQLSRSMSLTEFDNGYWYAAELKEFAKEIGIAHAGSLRKDELELAIKLFLKTGTIRS